MFHKENRRFWVWSAAIAYLAMIVVNALANLLPLNGVTTGAVSDSYPNLFAPTGLTFAVWGVIYLLLFADVAMQVRSLRKEPDPERSASRARIDALFAISSLANVVWIFAWHFRILWLSLAMMLLLLVCLILISFPLRREGLLARVAFGVYFGWITVATIANVTTLLVSWGLPYNTVGATLQTMVVLLVGIVIGGWTILVQKNVAYGAVFTWAYLGIYLKHIDPAQFDRGYAAVYNTALFGMIVLAALTVFVFVLPYLRNRLHRRRV